MSTPVVETQEKAIEEALLNEQHVAKFDEKIMFHKARALGANDPTVFMAEMDEVYAAEEAKARFVKWLSSQPKEKKKSTGSDKGFYAFAYSVLAAQIFYAGYLTARLIGM